MEWGSVVVYAKFPRVDYTFKHSCGFLLTREVCFAQTTHKIFQYEQDNIFEYLLQATDPEAMIIWACKGLHWYFEYRKKRKPSKVLRVKGVAIQALSVLVGNGYCNMLMHD